MNPTCMHALSAASAIAVLLGGAAAQAAAAAPPLVSTAWGQVQGVHQGAVDAFLGIPYAAPPVGQGRWRSPAPAAAWTGVRPADRFGASCMQAAPEPFGPYTAEFLAAAPFSEDCLFVNVWRPADRKGPLPVLVWFHGGGFDSGSGAIPIYNGAPLAAKGAVVVTVNYRLGVFGFLALPSLTAESPQHTSGDYGLEDQIASLRWVQANIARFGGDPARVTIAGQSAGAASVNDLIMSPQAKGLFSRAIAESGSGMGISTPSLAEAQAMGGEAAAAVGAASLEALRAMPAEELVRRTHRPYDPDSKAPPPPRLGPNVDGVVIAASPDDAAARPVNPVPLLTGFNTDEAMLPNDGQPSPADFEAMVRARYRGLADRFLRLYPHASPDQAAQAWRDIARDRYMAAVVLWAEARTRLGQPVWTYSFDHPYPVPKTALFRAFHTAEVPYVFGALDAPGRPFTARDRAVADQVQGYWLRFMTAGDPGRGWTRFAPGKPEVMGLGDRPGPRPAVSTPERLQAFRDHVAARGKLSLF